MGAIVHVVILIMLVATNRETLGDRVTAGRRTSSAA
jgi:hypothetical protein